VKTIETDYLVVGAGAMGMAFTFRRLPNTAATTPSPTSTPPAAKVRSSQWCPLLSVWPTKTSAIWRISPVLGSARH